MGSSEDSEQLAAVRSLADVLCGNLETKPVPRLPGDPRGRTHLVAGIFVQDASTGNFLVQRRARSRSWYPLHHTDSASGHVKHVHGLTLDGIKDEMARELAEEMGITCSRDEMQLWTVYWDPEFDEIKFVFAARVEHQVPRPDPVEVDAASGWIDPRHLSVMLDTASFVPSTTGLWRFAIEHASRFETFLASLRSWQDYWTHFDDLRRYREWLVQHASRVPVDTFLGRFQPFHRGHLQCIESIAGAGDHVLVACIGSPQYERLDDNPLSFSERRDIVRAVIQDEHLSFNDVFIIPLPDVHYEVAWMHNVVEILGKDTFTLHTNNDWVRGLATTAGIPLGPRLAFDVDRFNGTRVRRMARDEGAWGELVPRACREVLVARGLDRVL